MPDSVPTAGNSPTGPQPIVLQLAPAVAYISPLGFHHFASEFLQAARVAPRSGNGFAPVAYYLACHSIELSLKAFLLIHHVTRQDLKQRFGHNLEALLERAQSLGLGALVPLSDAQVQAVQQASPYYTDKIFEYFELMEAVRGFKSRPQFEQLHSAAEILVTHLKQPCLHAQ